MYVRRCVMNCRQDPTSESCERDNKTSASIKVGEYLERLRDYGLPLKNLAPWNKQSICTATAVRFRPTSISMKTHAHIRVPARFEVVISVCMYSVFS
jgi:hypothetical protein